LIKKITDKTKKEKTKDFEDRGKDGTKEQQQQAHRGEKQI
jgi:hypothetical protein